MPHQHNVNRLGASRFHGRRQRVKIVNVKAPGLQVFQHAGRIFRRAGNNRHRVDLLGIDDDLSALAQAAGIPGSLQLFKADDIVAFSFGHDRAIHLLTETHIGHDAAAALAHAVHFADLHIITFIRQQGSQQSGSQQASLSADADDHYTRCFHLSIPPIAPKAHSCSHTPQPTQSVLSILALPSLKLMDGQPIFMHFLQPRHLSVST